jgi:hypothetical protein
METEVKKIHWSSKSGEIYLEFEDGVTRYPRSHTIGFVTRTFYLSHEEFEDYKKTHSAKNKRWWQIF